MKAPVRIMWSVWPLTTPLLMMSALRLGRYRLESAWTATRNSTIKSWVRYGHRYLRRSLVMRSNSCWLDFVTSDWAVAAATQSAAGSVGGTAGGLHIEPMTRRRAGWIGLIQ